MMSSNEVIMLNVCIANSPSITMGPMNNVGFWIIMLVLSLQIPCTLFCLETHVDITCESSLGASTHHCGLQTWEELQNPNQLKSKNPTKSAFSMLT
jgi:hypothetical protein